MIPCYFIAVIPPNSLRHSISKIQHELFRQGHVMQPLKPHITLLHPDMLSTSHPIIFIPAVREMANEFLPIKVDLTGTALFDKRVLYITVESPALISLQRKLVSLLPDDIRSRYNVSCPFVPHITLAQAKPKQDLSEELILAFNKQIKPLLPTQFEAEHLTRFSWMRPRVYKTTEI